jgi:hypothetical protein
VIGAAFAFEEILAVLGFVATGVVQLFDFVMGFGALGIVAVGFCAGDV